MAAHFSQSLQENLLTLLCFSQEHCLTVLRAVDPSKFDGVYRDIAIKVKTYLDEQQVPPGVGHLPELLEEELKDGAPQAQTFKRALFNLVESKDEINPQYTLSKLTHFLNIQNLKEGIIQAANHLQQETETSVEEAQTILTQTLRNRVLTFEPGTFLGDPGGLRCFDEGDDALPTGIPELDLPGLGPVRKELHVLMGMLNRGKSWWLLNLGRQSLLQRLKVCHITLEMGEQNVVKRYYQSMFAIAKRHEEANVTFFDLDDLGRITGLDVQSLTPRHTFSDHDIRDVVTKRMANWTTKFNRLVVKEFPTGRLTMSELMAYLDILESAHHFVPDLLLIDYVDLMKLDTLTHRLDIGRVYKELRGLAMERNMAVATVSQSNRTGVGVRYLTEANVGEDFSKLQTADTVIAYNQTKAESKLNLARLYVMKARNDAAKFQILISQNYAMGQFCLSSTRVVKSYWDLVKTASPDEEGQT